MNVPTVKRRTDAQDVALLEAARYGNLKAVETVLKRGMDVNDSDSAGNTALLFAAMVGHLDVVKALLAANADTTIKNSGGWIPYSAAVFFGDFRGVTMPPHDQVVKLLKKETPNQALEATG